MDFVGDGRVTLSRFVGDNTTVTWSWTLPNLDGAVCKALQDDFTARFGPPETVTWETTYELDGSEENESDCLG